MRVKHLAIVFFVVSNINCFSQPEFVEINGNKMEVMTAGLGNYQPEQPIIVFKNGRRKKLDLWEDIIKEVSRKSTVFAYNRPRIGIAEDDSLPPTMKHIVDNLSEMLLTCIIHKRT